METITLTNKDASFRIQGREEKMSVEILKVGLHDDYPENLTLNIFDENGFLLYSKPLIPEPTHPNAVVVSKFPEVAVNKRFIFSAFITVTIEAPQGNPFSLEVHYV